MIPVSIPFKTLPRPPGRGIFVCQTDTRFVAWFFEGVTTMNKNLSVALMFALSTISLHAVSLLADSSARPMARQETKSTTPKQVIGKWIYGSVGPMTYWDSDTGKFLGNARGSAGIFEFDNEGRYRQYTYGEMRSYNIVNKFWTVHEGTVEFSGDTFTIRPTKGHYNGEMGSRKIDRDMTPEELEKAVATYHWRIERDDNDREHFIIPFEDGSRFDYRRDGVE